MGLSGFWVPPGLVFPSHVKKNNCVVPLSYVIRKYLPIPEYSENRDVQIIYQGIIVGNMFTRDSRKFLDTFK